MATVIIPTANRPDLVCRAIDSALSGFSNGDIEVVVVPNGPDQSWKRSLLGYRSNAAVRVIPVSEPSANVARNAGIEAATGHLVRFLDDDDYLFPELAKQQYEVALTSGADVCSGGARLVDGSGAFMHDWMQPAGSDFCAATIGPGRNTLPLVHVIRRDAIGGSRWSLDDPIRQDTHWLMDLCAEKELSWLRTDIVVGAWVQHRRSRVSLVRPSADRFTLNIPHHYYYRDRKTARKLLEIHGKLKTDNRLDRTRQTAIVQGLWGCVHAAYFTDPAYWSEIAEKAVGIDPDVRPVQPLYHWPLIRHLHPLTVQKLMAPKRRLSFYLRYFRKRYL